MNLNLNVFNDRAFLANEVFTHDPLGTSIESLPIQMSINHETLCSSPAAIRYLAKLPEKPRDIFKQFSIDAFLFGETVICWSAKGFLFWPPNWDDDRVHKKVYTNTVEDKAYWNTFKLKTYLGQEVDQDCRGVGVIAPSLPEYMKTNQAWHHDMAALAAFTKIIGAERPSLSYISEHQSFAQCIGLIYKDDSHRFSSEVINVIETRVRTVYQAFLADCSLLEEGSSFLSI